MTYIIAIIIVLLLVLAVKSSLDEKNNRKQLYESYKTWDYHCEEKNAEGVDFATISCLFHSKRNLAYESEEYYVIDEITCEDLGIDQVFSEVDSCLTFYGQETLYDMLRRPSMSAAELETRETVLKSVTSDSLVKASVMMALHDMGYGNGMPLCQAFEAIDSANGRSVLPDICQALLGVLATISIFTAPAFGFVFFLLILFVNVISYFIRKREIGPLILALAEVIRLIRNCNLMPEGTGVNHVDKVRSLAGELKSFCRGAFLLASGKGATGSLMDLALDYLRMFLHLDIIRFYLMLNHAKENKAKILQLSELVGMVDAQIAVARYRECKRDFCIPEFVSLNRECVSIELEAGYHPLVKNPVKNSIYTEKGVLVTGSNASGKSTFLRMVALNSVLAQSIGTVLADSYKAPMLVVASSMAISDNILSGDSYYLAEIKSLKRIMAHADGQYPFMCVIDEVLRGTNTAERIAASAEILGYLANRCMCFAATHDIELTRLLGDYFDNYHFTESIDQESGDITFGYQLLKGESRTRNAISLLGLMGYDADIVERARSRCDLFLSEGIWK